MTPKDSTIDIIVYILIGALTFLLINSLPWSLFINIVVALGLDLCLGALWRLLKSRLK